MTERTVDIRVGDRFRSNGGDGPLVAEVVEIDGDTIYLERWEIRRGRRTATGQVRGVRFALQRRQLASPGCGWKVATG